VTGRSALVIGGTGPSGPHLVEGLLERGFEVEVFHTGRHEVAELPEVPHLHGDPFTADGIADALDGRSYDVVIATYGRVRHLASRFAGACEQFLVVGGVPVYEGYVDPSELSPTGLRLPVREDAPLVEPDSQPRRGYTVAAIRRTEDWVFDLGRGGAFHATYFRYPTIYGPRNPHAWEWSIVRRVLDGRPWMLVPDDGRSVHSRCGARNAAHGILLAVDRPEVASGKAYNLADDDLLSIRQWAEVVADHTGGQLEIRSFPGDVPGPGWGLIAFRYQLTPHCILDTGAIRADLGYRDVLSVDEGLRETVAWMLEHRDRLRDDPLITDPFDYPSEDRLMTVWERCRQELLEAGAPFDAGVGDLPTPQTAAGAGKKEQ
jgi:nucleoside-diphosphate-sugar epimerase